MYECGLHKDPFLEGWTVKEYSRKKWYLSGKEVWFFRGDCSLGRPLIMYKRTPLLLFWAMHYIMRKMLIGSKRKGICHLLFFIFLEISSSLNQQRTIFDTLWKTQTNSILYSLNKNGYHECLLLYLLWQNVMWYYHFWCQPPHLCICVQLHTTWIWISIVNLGE